MYSKEKHTEYELKRYHKRRSAALEFLGGVCINCGSIDNLELDHIEPATKLFNISSFWSISENKFWVEVKKCQILCKICHLIKTTTIDRIEISHGDYGYYKHRKCRCLLCKASNAEYMRKYRSHCRVDKLVKSSVFETGN